MEKILTAILMIVAVVAMVVPLFVVGYIIISGSSERKANKPIYADKKCAKKIGKAVLKLRKEGKVIPTVVTRWNEVENIEKYVSKCDVKSLENGDYYVISVNDLIRVAIATSADEVDKITSNKANYKGGEPGWVYIEEKQL